MEIPNLDYIKQLSEGDTSFEEKLIEVLKKELPLEIDSFQRNYREKNFIKTAESVHKLKHKISILGLSKAYENASLFEDELRKSNGISRYESFVKTIEVISNFLDPL